MINTEQPSSPQLVFQTQYTSLTSLITPTKTLKLVLQHQSPNPTTTTTTTTTTIYHKTLHSLSQLGLLGQQCDSFAEALQYMRQQGNVKMESQMEKGFGVVELVILGRSLVKKDKIVELGRIGLQFVACVDGERTGGGSGGHEKCMEVQEILQRKVKKLQEQLYYLGEQLDNMKQSQSQQPPTVTQINQPQIRPPSPQHEYITKSQLATSFQILKNQLLSSRISTYFEAPTMIDSEYECPMETDLTDGEEYQAGHRMSFAENFLKELNDQRRKSFLVPAGGQTKGGNDGLVMEMIYQLQETLTTFMTSTTSNLHKINQLLLLPNSQTPQSLLSNAFKKEHQISAGSFEALYPIISEGLRNIVALSLELKYPIEITKHMFGKQEEKVKEKEEDPEESFGFDLFEESFDDEKRIEELQEKRKLDEKPIAKKAPELKKKAPAKKNQSKR